MPVIHAAPIPGPLADALSKNKKAAEVFHALGPSHQSEYVKWINEAKQEETQKRRADKTIEMILARI